jgi:hypothetical protein
MPIMNVLLLVYIHCNFLTSVSRPCNLNIKQLKISDVLRSVVFYAASYIRKIYVCKTPNKASLQYGWLVPTMKNRMDSSCEGLSSIIKVCCWSRYYSSWPNYCKGVCGKAGRVIRHTPWSKCCFRTMMQCSKNTMPPFIRLQLFSHALKSMRVNLCIFLGQHNITFENHWFSLVSFGG